VGGVLSLLSEAAGGGWLGMLVAERRAARRIVRATQGTDGRSLVTKRLRRGSTGTR